MVKPYSEDLRWRVVRRVAAGLSVREAAETFGVSVASVVKWSQRFRSMGSVAARPMGSRLPRSLIGQRDWRLQRIAAKPDVTLRELVAELNARAIGASYGSVWRLLRDEGISFKKSLSASEQDRPDVARRRARWKTHQGKLDPSQLVFIDETWAKTNMTCTHGRCAKGKRLIAKALHGRWRTLTFLAALRRDRIDAPCIIDGPINGRSFLAYVEQILIPTLAADDRPSDAFLLRR